MAVSSSCPLPLTVTLVSRHTPALTAGTYALTARQELSDSGGWKQTLAAKRTVRVEVAAPRFSLAPDDVAAVHPPPGANGDFSLVVPHLATADPLLPWSRNVAGGDTPWTVLLLVRDDEVRLDSGHVCTARTAGSLVGTPPAGVLFPNLGGTLTKTDTSACQTADLRWPALRALLPSRQELPWLAHVREVDRRDVREGGWEPGRYGVLVGNRLPGAAGRYTALLVSLEGHTGYEFLGGSQKVPDDTALVRMAVLWSWSFTHTPGGGPRAGAGFHALAERLARATYEAGHLLRLPGAGTDGCVHERLEAGYVPVAHLLPTGERAPAWYRGPLTPAPPAALPARAYRHADSALVFLAEQGVWDVSYACAYTLGKMLALADPSRLQALQEYRAQGHALLHAALRGPWPDVATDENSDSRGAARQQFLTLLSRHDLTERITRGLAKPRQEATDAAADASPGIGDPGGPGGVGPADVTAALAGRADAGPATDIAAEVRASLADLAARSARRPVWTAAPYRLESLPLDHLVPHEWMLPEHTARFFHIDAQWLAMLDAGARRVGTVTGLDDCLDALLAEALRAEDEDDGPVVGMLLRSPLVSAWPDLIVDITTASDDWLPPVIVARPQPDVLLALFHQTPVQVIVREAPHGLTLGIDSAEDGGTVFLRAPHDTGDTKQGQPLPGGKATGLDSCLRDAGTRVLHVHRKQGACLTRWLTDALAPHVTHTLTPASLALQLVNGAGRLVFVPVP
ncbi:hypothetical protein [Streptomyces buecherae]|uniref:hypothetical protein n=1 Tax=Streptomyces buecherae TaxID=2763006 RepID=UPI0037968563